jgi:hypothetical protein
MKAPDTYVKHIYWLTGGQESRVRAILAERGVKLKSGKAVMCPGLDEINKIISVAPQVWNGTCRRQGSWYWKSDKKGLYLIISSFDLEGFEQYKHAVITRSDFILPRPATRQEKQEMVDDEEFRPSVPQAWYEVSDFEKRLWIRWARRLGSDADWDTLFLTHTANHENFTNPRFFIEDHDRIIPYSIDRSANLCSCCLELFGVLGEKWKKKLVAPCSGAVVFSRLEKDRYLLVENS